jgi:hypothetical protein
MDPTKHQCPIYQQSCAQVGLSYADGVIEGRRQCAADVEVMAIRIRVAEAERAQLDSAAHRPTRLAALKAVVAQLDILDLTDDFTREEKSVTHRMAHKVLQLAWHAIISGEQQF